MMMDLGQPGVVDLATQIQKYQTKPSEVMATCLERVARLNPKVRAFQFTDPAQSMMRAKELDTLSHTGPLHGIPFAILDTIDTRAMPTGWGAQLYDNRVPERNAKCVDTLIEAGAVPIGKTRVPPFALGDSLDPSIDAISFGMAPFALCSGVTPSSVLAAFKPTHGTLDRQGVMTTTDTLDTLFFLARNVPDLSFIATALLGNDGAQSATSDQSAVRIGIPCNANTDASTILDASVTQVTWTVPDLAEAHSTIRSYEAARSRSAEAALGPARVGEALCDLVRVGSMIREQDYNQALQQRETAVKALDQSLKAVDAMLVPTAQSVVAELPHPCVTIPVQNAAPLHLIGARSEDARLLQIACHIFGQTSLGTS